MYEQPEKTYIKYSREEYSDDREPVDFYLVDTIALEQIPDSYFLLRPVSIYIVYSDRRSWQEAQQGKQQLNKNYFIAKLQIEEVHIQDLLAKLQKNKIKLVWVLFKAISIYEKIRCQLRREEFQNYHLQIFYLDFSPFAQQRHHRQISNGEWHKNIQLLNSAQKILEKYKQIAGLPNFIPIGLQNINKNIERVTLSAILNEEDKKMTNDPLLRVLIQQKHIKEDIKQQLLNNLSDKNVDRNFITIYTGNHFHHLLNNFLRMTNNPKKVFYFKEIIKQMYNQIKQEYIKAKKGKQQQHISLFRGAFMSQAQVQFLRLNKGKYVQSLGFLSTSINETMATGFMKNALIKITVTHQQRNEKLDHGYANISKQSDKPEEKEVLFNPLCIFRVEKVEFKEEDFVRYNYIQLTYCPIEKQTEKRITAIVEYDRREVQAQNQGHIFKKIEFPNERLRYWRKLAESYKGDSQSQKIQIQQQLIEALIAKQEYEQALKSMQEMKQAVDANPHLLKLCGDIHRGLNNNVIAKEYYLKSLQNLKLEGSNQQAFLANIEFSQRQQQYDSTSESMVQSLYSLSQIYIQLGETELASESSRNCLMLSNQYCSIKNKKYLNRLLKHSQKYEKITNYDLMTIISLQIKDMNMQQKDNRINYIIRLMLAVLLGNQADHLTKEKTKKQERIKNIQQLFEYAQILYRFQKESEYEAHQNRFYFYLRYLYLMQINQYKLALQNLQKSVAFYQKSILKMPQKALVYLQIAKLRIMFKVAKQVPAALLNQPLLYYKANTIKSVQTYIQSLIQSYCKLIKELGQQNNEEKQLNDNQQNNEEEQSEDYSIFYRNKQQPENSTIIYIYSQYERLFKEIDEYGRDLSRYCCCINERFKPYIDTYTRQKFGNDLQFAILQSQLIKKIEFDDKGSLETLQTLLFKLQLILKQSDIKSIFEESKRYKIKNLTVLIQRVLQHPMIAEEVIDLLYDIQLQQLELNLDGNMVIQVMSAKLESLKMLDMYEQALLFLTSLTKSKNSSLRQLANSWIHQIRHLIKKKQVPLNMRVVREYNL